MDPTETPESGAMRPGKTAAAAWGRDAAAARSRMWLREAAAEESFARRACAGCGWAASACEVASAVERPKLRGSGREEREERSERSVASAEEREDDALAGEECVCSTSVWTWVRRPVRVASDDRTVLCIVSSECVGTADNPVGSWANSVVAVVVVVVAVEGLVVVVWLASVVGEFGNVGD